jgi:hypothetical protein
LLRPFNIRSRQVWWHGSNQRGYRRSQLVAAWGQYVKPEEKEGE